MNDHPFAIEWFYDYPVFGRTREGHGHEFHASEGEMIDHARRLRQTVKVKRVLCYHRVNGELQPVESEAQA